MGVFVCNCKCFGKKEEVIEVKQENEDMRLSSEPQCAVTEEVLSKKYCLQSLPYSNIYFKTEPTITTLKEDELVINLETDNLNEKYLRQKILGKSSFVETWIEKFLELDKDYVIKIFKRRLENTVVNEIKDEINTLSELDHPNIVKIYDFHIFPDKFCVITDFCPEGNLYEEIIKRSKELSELECSIIIKQLLMAMRYFHKMKVIHRNIKPENILINKREDNGFFRVKLTDFNTAVTHFAQNEEELIGNSYFIAPEVINEKYDERCDIWSLGATMYVLLTTNPPFEPKEDDNEVLEEVKSGKYNKDCYQYKRLSSNAKDLLDRFLTVDPEQRISVKSALEHEWFKTAKLEDKNKINKISPEIARKLIKNIINYKKDSVLKNNLITYLFQEKIKLGPLSETSKLFKNIDKDKRGKITINELKEGLKQFWGLSEEETENLAKEIFNNIDTEENHYLEYKEFARASVDPITFLFKNYLKLIFNSFICKQSGKITIEIIKKKLNTNNNNTKLIIEKELNNILKKINIDENEEITLKIFCDIMQNILSN